MNVNKEPAVDSRFFESEKRRTASGAAYRILRLAEHCVWDSTCDRLDVDLPV